MVGVSAARRLRNDAVYDSELQAVCRVWLQRGGRLLRLAGIAPQNRCATLRRDDRVDGVLLHENSVSHGQRDCPSRPAFADHARDSGDPQANHLELTTREPATLPMLLSLDARIGTQRVDE